jgi:hypothetical protein
MQSLNTGMECRVLVAVSCTVLTRQRPRTQVIPDTGEPNFSHDSDDTSFRILRSRTRELTCVAVLVSSQKFRIMNHLYFRYVDDRGSA